MKQQNDKPRGPVLTDEEKVKVRKFMSDRDNKRHRIQMLVFAYVLLCIVALIVLDLGFGVTLHTAVIFLVMLCALLPFLPFAFMAWRRIEERERAAKQAEEAADIEADS